MMDQPMTTLGPAPVRFEPAAADDLPTSIMAPDGAVAMSTHKLQVWYGDQEALSPTTLSFPEHQITALIGASGSGKSTFLRCLNRMNDGIATVHGEIMYRDTDINAASANVYRVRTHIGMVFQRPNPFARSIRDNVTLALREHGMRDRQLLAERLEQSLRGAALWDEVKDVLDRSALELSGGQQQRLCIARALALRPDVLLLDEPASALDPIATLQIESTLQELRDQYTIIIVTHNMEQARRLSDNTAFFHQGHVREYARTADLFTTPRVGVTSDYIEGKFG